MLKNLLYAILLGVGMAACLADRDDAASGITSEEAIATEVTSEDAIPVPNPAEFLIAKGRVGSIRIGMPIDEMRQLKLPGLQLKDTTLRLEGQNYTAHVLSSDISPSGLVIEQQCEPTCQVWRLSIRDDDYKTAQGIGIGSKFSEVQQHYPIDYTAQGEAGFVAVSKAAGFSFVLDKDQLNKIQRNNLKPEDILANTLVKGILVY
ncbi:mechanosensitive ion channel protein MscS [Pontibacter sp. JH31]|uniref:Mechanosensitive ion channel protein MscS n=1 Tax=Pontibacter aquaedesilientis TaxID=2766980 RepID=A0ABR7XFB2_9BACT|nr:mechanosensitive ion channel protein MscS [Pontibacter aquaedesilientis]MBD1396983.1 mechanosensitive ion channel protein MscS [Pontibacter aquaedesilientis]